MILTAEVDSLPTDARKLLEDHGLVGCHSARGNNLSAHKRIDSTGRVRLLWESNDEKNRGSDAAIFEVKFGQRSEGPHTDSRERTADTLSGNLENVAEVLEENTTKSNFIPTTDCLRDTRERHLVTRSGLPRIRCCVCHLHHERAMNAPGSLLKFFKKVLQQVYNFKVDIVAGDANSQLTSTFEDRSTKICTTPRLPSC